MKGQIVILPTLIGLSLQTGNSIYAYKAPMELYCWESGDKSEQRRLRNVLFEQQHDKTNKMACALSEDWADAQADLSLR